MSEEIHTYVACAKCGVGIRHSRGVDGMCLPCAEEMIAKLRKEHAEAVKELGDAKEHFNDICLKEGWNKWISRNCETVEEHAANLGVVVLRARLREAYWLLTTDPTEPLCDFRAEAEAHDEYHRRREAFLESYKKEASDE